MSNYQATAYKANYDVMIGWDPMMNTYFLHVIDTSKEEEDPKRDVIWIGVTPDEIYSANVVLDKLEPYGHIDEVTRMKLFVDPVRPDEETDDSERAVPASTNSLTEAV